MAKNKQPRMIPLNNRSKELYSKQGNIFPKQINFESMKAINEHQEWEALWGQIFNYFIFSIINQLSENVNTKSDLNEIGDDNQAPVTCLLCIV